MSYVDLFVAAVPADAKETYMTHARAMWTIFKENGATGGRECWSDDVPDGKLTSFPMAVKKQDGEVVVCGWLEWPSKDVRDAGWEKAMQDPRMNDEGNPMPFDGKRMIFGGFHTIIDYND